MHMAQALISTNNKSSFASWRRIGQLGGRVTYQSTVAMIIIRARFTKQPLLSRFQGDPRRYSAAVTWQASGVAARDACVVAEITPGTMAEEVRCDNFAAVLRAITE
jgi:hypothetical protein